MVPFLMTANPKVDVTFTNAHIICIAATTEQVADAYIQNTTGIVPVRNSTSIITA
jgi:hypothetical protein